MADRDMTDSGNASDYAFTVDWFAFNISLWDKILPAYKPRRILEIGSYEGRSACYLIESCAARNPIEIHCIDTWQGGIEHDRTTMNAVEERFDRNVAIACARAKNPVEFVKHKELSHIALNALCGSTKRGTFDVIYIDGSHQGPDVLTDAVMSFQLLRVGGVMIFDDYIWSADETGKQDILNMPKLAVDAFMNVFQRKMYVLRGAPIYQLFAVKNAA